MPNTNPPFRADHVGSILRSDAAEGRARQARERRDHRGAAQGRRRHRDQEDHRQAGGDRLQLATDGEYRRSWWHFDFLEGLGGVEGYEAEHGIQFAGVETKARGVKVSGKLHWKSHPSSSISSS
jgi:5-methyltetrahydropteroyltriglutamate--homocysteine methyltransferase